MATIYNEKEYSRYMSDFRGIDATNEASNVALNRFSYIRNMYKDYRSGQGTAVETFPGTRTLANLGGKINGIYSYKSTNDDKLYVVVHAGEKLYRFAHTKRDSISDNDLKPIFVGMSDRKSQGFIFSNRLYIIDGEHYVYVDEEGKAREVSEEEAYVPTTYTNGEQYEQRNMLTNKFVEKTYFGSTEENDTDIFPAHQGAWEDEDGEYAVIAATLSEGLKYNDYYDDEGDKTGEDWSISSAEWSGECKINHNRAKIDFDKIIIVHDGVNTKYHMSYSSKPTMKTETKDCPDSTGAEDLGLYEDSSAHLSYTPDERKALLTSVTMTNRVLEIEGTFDGCSNLTELLLSNNVKKLSARFFAGTALDVIYLPAFLEELGDGAFDGCNDGVTIYASDTMYEILVADGAAKRFAIPSAATIKKYSAEKMVGVPVPDNLYTEKNRIYIYTPCKTISKVMNGEVEINPYAEGDTELWYTPVYQIVDDEEYIIAIELRSAEAMEINDTIFIHGIADSAKFTSATKKHLADKASSPHDSTDDSFIGTNPDYSGTAVEAIKGCTTCCTYDGRVFFTGNPRLPNTVFYTQRDLTGHNNPLYVGVLNYMNDGVGNTPNVAMMANAATLMVLKGNTIQDGSIYYHVGADGGNDLTPRIYPSTEGLAGLGCVGLAVNFRDDCVFMSSRGLEAIAKQTVNLERTLEHRSTNIDGLLLQSNLANARAAEWEGYLCILIDGKIYLADSRQMFEGIGGAIEYEWYYVDPVCGYNNDNPKYYLADYMPEEIQKLIDIGKIGIELSNSEDRSVDYKEVHGGDMCNCHDNVDVSYIYTIEDEDGNEKTYPIYYVERDGKKYFVDSDGERENGIPDKAVEIYAVDDVLYFGTTGGRLLCLNNDKRGTDEYEPDKSRIPVKWYNNSGHTYDAVAILAIENAGVPHYTKTTVKRGTVLRLKSFPQSYVEISVSTDRQARTLLSEQSNSITTFNNVDFSNLGLLTTDSNILAIKEKTKKWVEKQYMLEGSRCNKPFGIYSLTYRYFIAGGIKNQ